MLSAYGQPTFLTSLEEILDRRNISFNLCLANTKPGIKKSFIVKKPTKSLSATMRYIIIVKQIQLYQVLKLI